MKSEKLNDLNAAKQHLNPAKQHLDCRSAALALPKYLYRQDSAATGQDNRARGLVLSTDMPGTLLSRNSLPPMPTSP